MGNEVTFNDEPATFNGENVTFTMNNLHQNANGAFVEIDIPNLNSIVDENDILRIFKMTENGFLAYDSSGVIVNQFNSLTKGDNVQIDTKRSCNYNGIFFTPLSDFTNNYVAVLGDSDGTAIGAGDGTALKFT